VTWEWGAARAGDFTVLFGRVTPDDRSGSNAPLFVYVTDPQGFVALFRPKVIRYSDDRVLTTRDGPLHVPATAELRDIRGADTLDLSLAIDDAVATDTREGLVDRGEGAYARALRTPWFIQMAGTATIRGRIRGQSLTGSGRGFFETYR
jgi:hypothetical protein